MLVKDVASVCQEYTQRGGVRPFGVSLLIVGLEADGTPALYQVDPSGAYFAWRATAIGKNYVSAKNFLEKRWTADMELDDAIHTALLTLREGFEGEMTAHNIQVAVCRPPAAKSATATTTGTATGMPATISFAVLTPGQIQDYLDEAN